MKTVSADITANSTGVSFRNDHWPAVYQPCRVKIQDPFHASMLLYVGLLARRCGKAV